MVRIVCYKVSGAGEEITLGEFASLVGTGRHSGLVFTNLKDDHSECSIFDPDAYKGRAGRRGVPVSRSAKGRGHAVIKTSIADVFNALNLNSILIPSVDWFGVVGREPRPIWDLEEEITGLDWNLDIDGATASPRNPSVVAWDAVRRFGVASRRLARDNELDKQREMVYSSAVVLADLLVERANLIRQLKQTVQDLRKLGAYETVDNEIVASLRTAIARTEEKVTQLVVMLRSWALDIETRASVVIEYALPSVATPALGVVGAVELAGVEVEVSTPELAAPSSGRARRRGVRGVAGGEQV
jgi:hypothetical protein